MARLPFPVRRGTAGEYLVEGQKTTIFRGDLFQDLYMSLFMFTGKYDVQRTKDGLYSVRFQAYFRNNLPPGAYPYPFWHSAEKWDAYEKANDIRLRMDAKIGRAHV